MSMIYAPNVVNTQTFTTRKKMESALQTYLAYLMDKRQAQEAWLKSHGMTWTKLEELETEAIAEMQAQGLDRVNLEGDYVAELKADPQKLYPARDVKTIGYLYRISIHHIRR